MKLASKIIIVIFLNSTLIGCAQKNSANTIYIKFDVDDTVKFELPVADSIYKYNCRIKKIVTNKSITFKICEESFLYLKKVPLKNIKLKDINKAKILNFEAFFKLKNKSKHIYLLEKTMNKRYFMYPVTQAITFRETEHLNRSFKQFE